MYITNRIHKIFDMFFKIIPEKKLINENLLSMLIKRLNLLESENQKLKQEIDKHRVRISLLEYKME